MTGICSCSTEQAHMQICLECESGRTGKSDQKAQYLMLNSGFLRIYAVCGHQSLFPCYERQALSVSCHGKGFFGLVSRCERRMLFVIDPRPFGINNFSFLFKDYFFFCGIN